jgi:hypothetical protein
MKYVLRNKTTGRYLKRIGHWVNRLEEAMTFGDLTEVREYCQAYRIDNVQPIRHLMPYLLALLRSRSSSRAANV